MPENRDSRGFITQVVKGRYLDEQRLKDNLRERFGEGNFKAKKRGKDWKLTIPEEVDEAFIRSCEVDSDDDD